MAADEIGSLGWEDMVALRRKVAGELKEVTDRLVDIDRKQFHAIISGIKQHRSAFDAANERSRQIKAELDKQNSDLLAVSEKISQSKNFLSMMEARLPAEDEQSLQAAIAANQALIDNKQYKGEREKGEILSRVKDASMKMEAIKATRTIKEQYALLLQQSSDIGNAAKALNDEHGLLRSKAAEANAELDRLYDAKRALAQERERYLATYEGTVKRFDAINARLDEMSAMRKRQREEYGYNLPSDALFKVKEMARKKLEEGSKLSLDELRLLYSERE
ncbi:hypothetical protein [Candidatus Nitrososphaera sp. FF02]|uniref:hypothetical protein n=1 Tax=Candidatus Nitrososphaera sp. FF02 TaxID=3398226 RepID=UPI0039E8D7C9